MQELNPPNALPNVECDYQPEPDSLAGFLAGLQEKVDEVLTSANWRSDAAQTFDP